MKIIETTAVPIQAEINGQPVAMIQKLSTWAVFDDKDMIAVHNEMSAGRDIVTTLRVGEGTYVMLRELLPTTLNLGEKKGIITS